MTAGTRTTFPAMGSTVHVVVHGPAALATRARRRIADLEQKWTRFSPTSEVGRLNRASGPLVVSADTRLLLRRGTDAWTLTAGAFDPTVHDAIVRWGYDRDLALVVERDGGRPPAPAPGLASVVVDDVVGTVDPGGVRIDPGGIGKGLAADLVAAELIDAGATSVLIGVGGDVRVAGEPPAGGWTIGVEDPTDPEHDLCLLDLTGGALATSSTRRRWPTANGHAHHLFDPRTGSPAEPALTGVTVLAGEGWWAEALTKAVMVGGLPAEALGGHGGSGLGVTRCGALAGTPDLLHLAREAA